MNRKEGLLLYVAFLPLDLSVGATLGLKGDSVTARALIALRLGSMGCTEKL